MPVSFRYNIDPIESKRTNVFKPNALAATSDSFKANSVGAVYIGKWADLPDSANLDILWEAVCAGGFGGCVVALIAVFSHRGFDPTSKGRNFETKCDCGVHG